ncbi:MAG: hypothetical protein ACE5OZ_21810 [Candidatus Heimdallarchaeota archaeon]
MMNVQQQNWIYKRKMLPVVMLLLAMTLVGASTEEAQAQAPKEYEVPAMALYVAYPDDPDYVGGIGTGPGYLGSFSLVTSPFDFPQIEFDYSQLQNIYLKDSHVLGDIEFYARSTDLAHVVTWSAFSEDGYYSFNDMYEASSSKYTMQKKSYYVYFWAQVMISGGSSGDWGRINSGGSTGELTITFSGFDL